MSMNVLPRLCAVLLALLAAGCDKPTAQPSAEPATTAGGASTAALPAVAPTVGVAEQPQPEADSPRLQSGIEVINAYAQVRAALAADDLAAARKLAPALGAKARAAAGQLPATDKANIDALASAADRLAAIAEIEAARLEFGNASKALISLVAAEASLQHGLIAYRCPMAKGYQKWIQIGDEMANPYMGAKMLHCGGKVALTP